MALSVFLSLSLSICVSSVSGSPSALETEVERVLCGVYLKCVKRPGLESGCVVAPVAMVLGVDASGLLLCLCLVSVGTS